MGAAVFLVVVFLAVALLAAAFVAGAFLAAVLVAGAFVAAVFLAGLAGSGATSEAGWTTSVMWLVRLLMRVARPWARGRQRFIVGPSSTCATDTTRSWVSRPSVVSAFATALRRTLCTVSAAACGANWRMDRAWSTGMPRTRSTTRRAFIGVIRT